MFTIDVWHLVVHHSVVLVNINHHLENYYQFIKICCPQKTADSKSTKYFMNPRIINIKSTSSSVSWMARSFCYYFSKNFFTFSKTWKQTTYFLQCIYWYIYHYIYIISSIYINNILIKIKKNESEFINGNKTNRIKNYTLQQRSTLLFLIHRNYLLFLDISRLWKFTLKLI